MEPRNRFRGIDFASLLAWPANWVALLARQDGNRLMSSLKGLQIRAQMAKGEGRNVDIKKVTATDRRQNGRQADRDAKKSDK